MTYSANGERNGAIIAGADSISARLNDSTFSRYKGVGAYAAHSLFVATTAALRMLKMFFGETTHLSIADIIMLDTSALRSGDLLRIIEK